MTLHTRDLALSLHEVTDLGACIEAVLDHVSMSPIERLDLEALSGRLTSLAETYPREDVDHSLRMTFERQ